MATRRREFRSFHARDRAHWRAWLTAHHDSSDGVWLIYDKKGARADRLAYGDAVEEALCFGWIDSVINAIDDAHYRQLYSPRKPGSEWSALNKRRVAKLIAEKRMTKAGLAKIAAARKNGAWTRVDHVEALVVPDDLAAALAKNKKALANFAAASRSLKKVYLHRVGSAKRPETRAARIRQVVAWAKENIRPGMTRRRATE
jgi:uncharacterized protein YdeI (YjbR/CyaY-like superfamily)